MCLGTRTEFQVFEAIGGNRHCRGLQHTFDSLYNFFNRSAWQLSTLACCVATQIVVLFCKTGEIALVVDGTLLLKSGKHVHMAGWFYDGNTSTKKRLATGRGNKWVVIGILVPLPATVRMICLPVHAGLQPPGTDVSSEAQIAKKLLADIVGWFPERTFLLVGDGGFSSAKLLGELAEKIRYVGLMRSNAAIHSVLKKPEKRKPGRPAQKGKRLQTPTKMFATMIHKSSATKWTRVEARGTTYQVRSMVASWPRVTKNRPLLIVLCHPMEGGVYKDLCLFTTDIKAVPKWVIETYAQRPTIETAFRSSKQAMQIERPKHWSPTTVKKLAPWVWLMQSMIVVWYLTEGRHTPEANEERKGMGHWESEWSLEFMLRLLRRLIVKKTINATPRTTGELMKLCARLENYLFLAS